MRGYPVFRVLTVWTEMFLFHRLILFCDWLQGANVVDESHDQDTTDLHKCVSFITRNLPAPENSNVSCSVDQKHKLTMGYEVSDVTLISLIAAMHSCPWRTWRKIRSWDGEHQCIIPLLRNQDRPLVRRLFNFSASEDARSHDPHWGISRGTSLWLDSHWRTIG
jgi:hypothetical protein